MFEVARSNVKPGKRVGQTVDGKIREEMVEQAQGMADFTPVSFILDDVEGLSPLDEAEGTPERTVGVNYVVPAVSGQEHPRQLEAAATTEGLAF